MCLGMNPDKLTHGPTLRQHVQPQLRRSARAQAGRTHLLSPAMAAAAAITGRLVRRQGDCVMQAFHHPDRRRGPAAARQR